VDTVLWLLLIFVVVGVAFFAYTKARKDRTAKLKARFGPEYDRTLKGEGDRRAAEKELREREERRSTLDIRPLDPAARERYSQSWTETQARFVDDPTRAIKEADALVTLVMRDRGYPVEDFEQRAADVSVDHPHVVRNYRAANKIATANERGDSSTEDLRQAMVHYRELFEELLNGRHADSRGEESATHPRSEERGAEVQPSAEERGAEVRR
jgi:hypothetical protein